MIRIKKLLSSRPGLEIAFLSCAIFILWLSYICYGEPAEQILTSAEQTYLNLAKNASFEAWSGGAPRDWTQVETPTLAEITTGQRLGAKSLQVTRSGVTAEGMSQTITIEPNTTYSAGFYYKVVSGAMSFAITGNLTGAFTLTGATNLNDTVWSFKSFNITTGGDSTVTLKWTADADTNAFQLDGVIFVRGSFAPGFIPAYITDQGGQTIYGDLSVTGTITGMTATGGGWTDSGTNVYLTTGTDNVGIGTTGPSSKLDISGGYLRVRNGIDIDAGQKILGNYIGNNNCEYTYLQMYNPADASVNIGTKHSLGYISFESGSGAYTERMRITNTGNVGIGTTSPTQKLEVLGTIKATTLDGAINTSGNLTTSGNLQVSGTGPHYISQGNVGIGTTGPGAKLEIASGDIALQTAQKVILDSNDTGDLSNSYITHDATNNRLNIYVDGNLIAWIKKD